MPWTATSTQKSADSTGGMRPRILRRADAATMVMIDWGESWSVLLTCCAFASAGCDPAPVGVSPSGAGAASGDSSTVSGLGATAGTGTAVSGSASLLGSGGKDPSGAGSTSTSQGANGGDGGEGGDAGGQGGVSSTQRGGSSAMAGNDAAGAAQGGSATHVEDQRVAATEAARRFLRAFCAIQADCERGLDIEFCVDTSLLKCNAFHYGRPGWAEISDDEYIACAENLEGGNCSYVVDYNFCVQRLINLGRRSTVGEEGDLCGAGRPGCGLGYCEGGGGCGVCVDYALVGDSCADRRCGSGECNAALICEEVIPEEGNAGVGESCTRHTDCARPLRCGSGACEAVPALGDACSNDVRCALGLECTSGTCQRRVLTCTPGREGESCDLLGRCEDGLLCSPDAVCELTGTPLGAVGDSCNSSGSCLSERCESTVCSALEDGQPCKYDGACASGSCIDYRCGGLYPEPPPTCD